MFILVRYFAEIFRLQLSEVLDGADHLRGVGVLVVVPRNDLNLIGVPSIIIAVLLFLCPFGGCMLSFFVEKFHNNCRSWETFLFLYLDVDLRSRILAFSTLFLLLYCGFPACFIYSL